jgi:hypothetical protein
MKISVYDLAHSKGMPTAATKAMLLMQDRITALIAAGDKLNELACHQDDCEIVTHGVWSDPIPCTCGYTDAWKKWQEVRGDD